MYNILSSSSSGLSIIYNKNVLVDIGVPFVKIKDYVDDIRIVLISHKHTDHLNIRTLQRLQKENENVIVACGEWLEGLLTYHDIKNIKILDFNKWYNLNYCKVALVQSYHDVESCGFRLVFDDRKVFHMTDTCTLDGINAKDYDYYLVEGNHDEDTIDHEIALAEENGEFTYKIGAKNSHLSFQQAREFVKRNAKVGSQVQFLHTSKQYLDGTWELSYVVNDIE